MRKREDPSAANIGSPGISWEQSVREGVAIGLMLGLILFLVWLAYGAKL